MENDQFLIIPVYLNQRSVFDSVAMLQDGIATVTRISETYRESTSSTGEVGATFGLNKALASLLKINLSAKITGTSTDQSNRSRSEERVHTPASLFFTVRKILNERNILSADDDGVIWRPGDVVEFSASLKRNPIIETMDGMSEIMNMVSIFVDSQKQHKGGKPQEGVDFRRIKTQIESFAATLKAGDTIDLTTGPLKSGFRAVVTLETQYLNDPSMADLVDGTFNVVGKVIHVVKTGDGAISLIRKTGLSRMPMQTLEQSFKGIKDMGQTQGFPFPELKWEIEGPVIQVIPIAIFT